MELYTFILDYLGGTYISQVSALNYQDAIIQWMQNLDVKNIEGFTIKDKERIVKSDHLFGQAVMLEGVKNVWYFLIHTKEGTGHINFIKTKY